MAAARLDDDRSGAPEPPISTQQPAPPPGRTEALARLLARAAIIYRAAEGREDMDFSFTSVMLALLVSEDPISRWFSGYVQSHDVRVDAMLERRGLTRQRFEQVAAEPIPDDLFATQLRPSEAGQESLGRADDLRAQISPGEADTDVRHFVAAHIYFSSERRDLRLVEWGLSRPELSSAFLSVMRYQYVTEYPSWKALHIRTFPDTPLDDGPAARIATDLWTVDDVLGHRAYAYAIYKFMTHEQTRPPLTVSIQAPWGGGKTSLMRMIQEYLDPGASKRVEGEALLPRGSLTVRDVTNEIRSWIQGKQEAAPADPNAATVSKRGERIADSNVTSAARAEATALTRVEALQPLPPSPTGPGGARKQLTIWFNVWKYQSSSQVWAGLADAIMHQVAAQYPTVRERERFWLQLNLKRLDADRIRRAVYQRIFRYWLRSALPWLIGTTVTLAVGVLGLIASNPAAQVLGWSGMAAAALGAADSVRRFFSAKDEVEKEPADEALGQFLDMPDYRAELGFVHHVEADMRRVFAVAQERMPIVIFIDDLDRCSPDKVAEVVEGINLFLAGEFPDCMFVIGMDTEMVAAALETSHEKMIAHLPADLATPIGWRFMDKFVQLPFVIPTAQPDALTRYRAALLSAPPSKQEGTLQDVDLTILAAEAAGRMVTPADLDREMERLSERYSLDRDQTTALRAESQKRYVTSTVDAGVATFGDESETIRKLVDAAADTFSENPRELKRFVNTFRFQYFLWWAIRSVGGGKEITLDQLQRWTVLSMRWPDVVRWTRRGTGRQLASGADGVISKSRLQLLEEYGRQATDQAAWERLCIEAFRLDPKRVPWVQDESLRRFFRAEPNEPDNRPLSAAAGKGLW
jgi:hypothetical protein